MTGSAVTVLVPAYNEEQTIYETVSAARSIREVRQVIVIDDGSSDSTALCAANAGATVVSAGKNIGKGGALSAGSGYVSGGIVLLLDADLGKSAACAGALLDPLLAGKADMTVAVFPPGKKKAGFGLVKGLARAGIKHFTGLCMDAPLSGQRAMISKLYFELQPFSGGFGVEVGLTVKAAARGYRIIEVPVNLQHRETGQDIGGIMHRGKQFWHVARTLLEHYIWCG